ncbi:hypothetical protein KFE25_009213 [Diacronema lutheri]|uniref:Trafficking protein particle complex subunit 2-like protein n=1 Tax=Diacronema lutheri TaxID=2081491 RepID=A0A8J5XYF9_DIALT|nr:hypothetical protein KFE25_009213 [Diacronema lutheri]
MAAADARAQAVCVAVVSRANRPLFVCRVAEGVDELRLHHVVHSCLDIFDERRAAPTPPGAQADAYLGLLQPAVDFRVYGYVTNTATKLVVVMSDGDVRELELRQLLRRLHGLVIHAVSNPFYVAGTPIVSTKFEAGVRQLVASAR